MEQAYQDVKLTPEQWGAFRTAARSARRIKSPHDLDVAVNYFLRLWYARTEWFEQEIEVDRGDRLVKYSYFGSGGVFSDDDYARPIGEPIPLKDRYSFSELEGLFCPRFEGEWTMPAVSDIPLTGDGVLADPEMLCAWKDYCGAT